MSIIVRKLRLQRGWTQDQLAEFAGLSVRSVQRVERGAPPSLETLKALAAVFEVDIETLENGDPPMTMTPENPVAADEKEAIEYVKGIKEFYQHAFMFVLFTAVFGGVFGTQFGFDSARVQFMLLGFLGWMVGVIVHGLTAFEVLRFFGPRWERELIEKRLGRRL